MCVQVTQKLGVPRKKIMHPDGQKIRLLNHDINSPLLFLLMQQQLQLHAALVEDRDMYMRHLVCNKYMNTLDCSVFDHMQLNV